MCIYWVKYVQHVGEVSFYATIQCGKWFALTYGGSCMLATWCTIYYRRHILENWFVLRHAVQLTLISNITRYSIWGALFYTMKLIVIKCVVARRLLIVQCPWIKARSLIYVGWTLHASGRTRTLEVVFCDPCLESFTYWTGLLRSD